MVKWRIVGHMLSTCQPARKVIIMGSMEYNQKLLFERAEQLKKEKLEKETFKDDEVKTLLLTILSRLDDIEKISSVVHVSSLGEETTITKPIDDEPVTMFIPSVDDTEMKVSAEKPKIRTSSKKVDDIADSVSKLKDMGKNL